jgi:hypothetical protein
MADRLLSEGKDPIDALVRIAEKAEANGDLALALSSWKSVVTYVYPRPKPVESEPDLAIELARATASARRPGEEAGQGGDANSDYMITKWIDDLMDLAEAAMDFGLAEKLGLLKYSRPKPSTLYNFDSEEEAALADEEWVRREENLLERPNKRRREVNARKAAGAPPRDMLDMNVTRKTLRRSEQRQSGASAHGLGGFDTGEAA